MAKIIEFKSATDKYLIEFDEFLNDDGYIKLTAINALDSLEFEISPEGVKEFQKTNELEVTGIIDIETFGLLIQVFEPKQIQDILHHLDNKKPPKKKETNNWKLFWYSAWALLYFCLGFYHFYYYWIYKGIILKLFLK